MSVSPYSLSKPFQLIFDFVQSVFKVCQSLTFLGNDSRRCFRHEGFILKFAFGFDHLCFKSGDFFGKPHFFSSHIDFNEQAQAHIAHHRNRR